MRREQVGDNDVVGVPLASITTFIDAHSQWALLLMFTLLLLESFGLPVPGETALIACSVLASQGALPIVWVVVVGALAGILGGGGLGLRDTGLPNAQLRRLGADLEPRQAILCVLVSKDGLLRLREALEPYGEVFETEVEGAAP